MKKLSLRVLTCTFVALFGIGLVVEPSRLPQLDRALRETIESHDSTPVRVIVHARDGAIQRLREVLAHRGTSIQSEQTSIDAVTATLTPVDILALARQPEVVRI